VDKFEQLARDAEYAVAILANLDTHDTQFVDLQAVPTDAARTFAGRGLDFVGVVGLVKGQPRVALAVELDAESITAITQAFIHHVRKLSAATWAVPPDRNAN
jgi:hypothetical protein